MTAPSESRRIAFAFLAGWMAATLFTVIAAGAVTAPAAIVASAAMMALFVLSSAAYSRFTRNRVSKGESADFEDSSSKVSADLSLEERCELYAKAHGLTPRQGEVCLLLVLGRSVGDIADELYISKDTVKTHVKSLYTKTGAHSRQELIAAVYGFEA